MSTFAYGQAELDWLASRDAILGEYIAQKGIIRRNVYPDPFLGLCRSVIGQQLSDKAHNAIWNRFLSNFPQTNSETLLQATEEDIKSCGMSLRKARTIREISRLFANNDLSGLNELSDEELINKLLVIKGIGKWTAEMLLIFTFQRKNILSTADLGLKKGLCNLYGYREATGEVFERHKRIYSPYASIAAFYLWEVASLKPVKISPAC